MNTLVNFSEVQTKLATKIFSIKANDFRIGGVTVDVEHCVIDVDVASEIRVYDNAGNALNVTVMANYTPIEVGSKDGFLTFSILADEKHSEMAEVESFIQDASLYINETLDCQENELLKRIQALAEKDEKLYRVGLVKRLADQGIMVA